MLKYLKFCSLLLVIIYLFVSCCKETKDFSGWTSYTSNGLSDGVNAIAIDMQGDKWFAIFNGIIKFDGSIYTLYNDSNSALVSNRVYCISIDAQNNKWIGTDGGVSKFDGNNWTTYLSDTTVQAISIDPQNNIWFSKRGYGLSKFDGANWTSYSTTNCGLPSNYISTIAINNKNIKWFGDEFEGRVTRYDDKSWNLYTIPNPTPAVAMLGISAMAIDVKGNAWIEVPLSGVFKFDDTNWITILGDANVHSLAIDNKGYGWVGYQVWFGGGVSKFDGEKWVNYNIDNSGIINNWITCIAIDKQGNKWIGTRVGVSVFKD